MYMDKPRNAKRIRVKTKRSPGEKDAKQLKAVKMSPPIKTMLISRI